MPVLLCDGVYELLKNVKYSTPTIDHCVLSPVFWDLGGSQTTVDARHSVEYVSSQLFCCRFNTKILKVETQAHFFFSDKWMSFGMTELWCSVCCLGD